MFAAIRRFLGPTPGAVKGTISREELARCRGVAIGAGLAVAAAIMPLRFAWAGASDLAFHLLWVVAYFTLFMQLERRIEQGIQASKPVRIADLPPEEQARREVAVLAHKERATPPSLLFPAQAEILADLQAARTKVILLKDSMNG